MPRSAEEIANIIARKANMLLLQELPEPSCPQKKLKWRWEVERVKKLAAAKIWPENNGVNIEIKV